MNQQSDVWVWTIIFGVMAAAIFLALYLVRRSERNHYTRMTPVPPPPQASKTPPRKSRSSSAAHAGGSPTSSDGTLTGSPVTDYLLIDSMMGHHRDDTPHHDSGSHDHGYDSGSSDSFDSGDCGGADCGGGFD